LLEVILARSETLEGKPDLLKFVVYQTLDNIRNPEYYKGASITYSHISNLLEAIRVFKLEGEELSDSLKLAEFLLMKAISISDREHKYLESHGTEVIQIGEKLLKGSEKTNSEIIKMQLETLEQLSCILIDYSEFQEPTPDMLALLAFEADYIMKQNLKSGEKPSTSPQELQSTSELPLEIIKAYIDFQYLLASNSEIPAESPPAILKTTYLRIINLVSHNESFQHQANEKVYL
jgi:hypothetical protein